MMTTPESNEAPAKESAAAEEAVVRELSLEDLDDVAGGGVVVHERTNEQNDKRG